VEMSTACTAITAKMSGADRNRIPIVSSELTLNWLVFLEITRGVNNHRTPHRRESGGTKLLAR